MLWRRRPVSSALAGRTAATSALTIVGPAVTPRKARAFAKELVALKSNVSLPTTNQVTEIAQQETW